MNNIVYEYSQEPSGKYDKPVYHCVTKYTNSIFQWAWSLPTEEIARQFIVDNKNKDLPYPGYRK